jgi:hypothetical protein
VTVQPIDNDLAGRDVPDVPGGGKSKEEHKPIPLRPIPLSAWMFGITGALCILATISLLLFSLWSAQLTAVQHRIDKLELEFRRIADLAAERGVTFQTLQTEQKRLAAEMERIWWRLNNPSAGK